MRGLMFIHTLFFFIHLSSAEGLQRQTCTSSVKNSCTYTCGSRTYLLKSVPTLSDVQRCQVGNSTLVFSVCEPVECGGHSDVMVCLDDTVPLINRSCLRVSIDSPLKLSLMYFQSDTSYKGLRASIILALHKSGLPRCRLGTKDTFDIFIQVENVPTSSNTTEVPSVTTPAPHGQGGVVACSTLCFIALSGVAGVVGISLLIAFVVVAVRKRHRSYTSIEATYGNGLLQ